jgi:Helix-turn-helix domain
MDERLRFVARLLDGEKMAALCREFDVSRKTGYKIFQRYKDCGLEGLTDRSRRLAERRERMTRISARLIQEWRVWFAILCSCIAVLGTRSVERNASSSASSTSDAFAGAVLSMRQRGHRLD